VAQPHRIRLRKPWQCQAGPDGLAWRRRFGQPTGLRPADAVWLVVEAPPAAGTVELNREPLGRLAAAQSEARFDVTGRLAARNEVSILLAGDAGAPVFATATAGEFPGSVYLEIVPPPAD
jgi:hypothetical protein